MLIIYILYLATTGPTTKPQAVVVQGGQTPQSGSVVITPVSQQTTSYAACDYVYIRFGGIEACNVVAYGDFITVQSPGWIKGSFVLLGVEGSCAFETSQQGLRVLGKTGECKINIQPVKR